MTSFSNYHQLAAAHQPLLQRLTEGALNITAIERLYLLGLATAQHQTGSLFSAPASGSAHVSHAWLLALVPAKDHPLLHEVQDRLENKLQPLLPVTVLVLSVEGFRNWLLEGHPFARAVCQQGYRLFGNEEPDLPLPTAVAENGARPETAQRFRHTETAVQAFLAGAGLYMVRMQYGLAAFMLHQAAEQLLRTLLIGYTGLRLNTHNLDRLLRWCTLACPELHALFPRNTEADKRLFGLLQQAYVDARYADAFAVRREEAKKMQEAIEGLHEIFTRRAAVDATPPLDCRSHTAPVSVR